MLIYWAIGQVIVHIKSRMKQRASVNQDRMGAVAYHRPIWFWLGVSTVTAGVLLHIPMYLHGRHNGYRLVGMPMDAGMLWGMAAIVVGLAASLYGLFPGSG